MDRVSGWYKNRVQVWTVVIASIVTILMNADTIQIAQKLMVNPALREKIVEEAKAPNGPNAAPTGQTLTAQQKADLSGLTGWTNEFRIFHHLDACADPSLRGPGLTEADCRPDRTSMQKPNPKFVAAWNSDCVSGYAPVKHGCVSMALGSGSRSHRGLDSNRDCRFSGSAILVRHSQQVHERSRRRDVA